MPMEITGPPPFQKEATVVRLVNDPRAATTLLPLQYRGTEAMSRAGDHCGLSMPHPPHLVQYPSTFQILCPIGIPRLELVHLPLRHEAAVAVQVVLRHRRSGCVSIHRHLLSKYYLA